jgi:hypothetical protein
LKNRSFAAQLFAGLLLAAFTLGLTACHVIYYTPQNNFAGRPIPPSKLLTRVLVTYTNGGVSGGADMIDAYRDLRSNVQNTIPQFAISGVSAPDPVQILSFPEQTHGYLFSPSAAASQLVNVNYSTEASTGAAASFSGLATSVAAAYDGSIFAAASENIGQLYIASATGSYALNLPNVYQVSINQGNSVILAMVRNSNTLYRVIRLPQSSTPVVPPGAVDCEPLLIPVYCVVPVPGTYDRPYNAVYSNDGSTVYVLNCGPECGGTTAGVTVLQEGALVYTNVPTVDPLSSGAPSPLATLPGPNPIPIPSGATDALQNGTTLYISGQSLYSLGANGALGSTPRADGLFTGYLTALDLSTYTVAPPVSISDGTHTKMLFADDDTLWVGSQHCASGERHATGQNYNCLTRVDLSSGAVGTASIVPDVTPGGSTIVPYPNTNQDPYYYGDLTGLCWVQNYHKVYTAYGGQVHAFNTADGSEINNYYITIQGTALDVAFMDALTNSAN